MAARVQQPAAASTSQLVIDLVDTVAANVAGDIVAHCRHVTGPMGGLTACRICIFQAIRNVIAASNDIALPEN